MTMTVRFSRETVEVINRLKTQYGTTSTADIFKRGLALLQVASDAKRQGGSIGVKDKEGVVHEVTGLYNP